MCIYSIDSFLFEYVQWHSIQHFPKHLARVPPKYSMDSTYYMFLLLLL